jgi:hypothetical protein
MKLSTTTPTFKRHNQHKQRVRQTGSSALIIVDRFDAQKLESFISAKVRGTSGATKDELFVKLSRFASWEFDYKFDPLYQRPT